MRARRAIDRASRSARPRGSTSPRSARLAVILFFIALPSVARANYTFQGTVTASGGWTSNAAAAATGTPGDVSDGVFLVNPGVIFTSALARAVQRLSYNFSTLLYVNNPQLDSFANRLDWSGFFLTSPSTDLQLGAYVLQQTNGVIDTSAGQITRAGPQSFWGAGLTQAFSWSPSQVLRLTQGASFVAYIPTVTGLGPTYTGTANLGLGRSWLRDWFGGNLMLGYVYYAETRGPTLNLDGTVNPDGVVQPAQQQISGNFMLQWRHDFKRFWNLNLGGGVAALFRANDGGGQIWQPVGEAGVHYLHPRIQIDLTYTRALVPSVVVQRTFVSDSVSLHGTVPFGDRSRVAFTGGGNYVHSQTADTSSGNVGSSVDVFFVDGAINWTPLDWLSVFTRYTYQAQLADATQEPPIASIERHQVMLGLTAIYPAQAAALVPNRAPVRVDRSDAVTIPDLHAPPPRR